MGYYAISHLFNGNNYSTGGYFWLLAGLYRNSWFDHVFIVTNMVFNAVPTIVTGPLMVFIFAVLLHWLPASSWGDGSITYLVLPVTALTLAYAPTIAFVTRKYY